MNLGNAIKALRKRKKLKQMELARSIGLSQTSLSLIESGNTQPSKDTIKRICTFFEVPEPFLYFLALEESDIPDEKKELYKALVPGLKVNIEALFAGDLSAEGD